MTLEKAICVEWAPFRVQPEITTEQLLEAANRLEKEFLLKQSGYVKRELLKGTENRWVDLIYWETEIHASQAFSNAAGSAACADYFSLMKPPEETDAGVSHFTLARSWRTAHSEENPV